MSSITLKIVNPALIEGGPDATRNSFGGFYTIATADDGQQSLEYSASNLGPSTATRISYPDNELVKYSQTFTQNVVTASSNVVIPSYTVKMVVAGREESIKNDEHWRSIVVGGTYDSSSYTSLVEAGGHEDTAFTIQAPYDLLPLKEVVGELYPNYEYITPGYMYNYYHPKYERNVKNRSVYQIPNLYLLNAAYLGNTAGIHEDLNKFINLDGAVEESGYLIDTMFASAEFKYPPPAESDESTSTKNMYYDEQHNYKTYADLYIDAVFTGSVDTAINRQRNIIFDKGFMDLDDVNFFSLPYYMDTSWSTPDIGTLGQMLKDSAAQSIFMKMIKNEFVDNAARVSTLPTFTQHTTVSASTWGTTDFDAVLQESYRSFDLLPQLAAYMISPDRMPHNFEFFTDDALERKILTDPTSTYRYVKKKRMMNFFSDLVRHVDLNYSKKAHLEDNSHTGSLSSLLDEALNSKPSEILGYRVEKIGGSPLGDSRSLPVLSNYYFFNDDLPVGDDGKFHFYDTQVKYGHEYTYNVYQYMTVIGWRYRYGSPEITRQIGTTDIDGEGDGGDRHCLEFYNPVGNVTSTGDRPASLSSVYTPLSGSGDGQNPYATSAQVLSKNQYLCMFDYTIEPYVRIVEVPISSKNLSVLDHPPRAVEVIPYQKKDDSQTIGFYTKYESFVKQPYPATIGPVEGKFKKTYLDSNNLTEAEKIPHASTKPVSVQVFRLDEKPKSYNDFENNLVATKTLQSETFEFPFTDCIYEERIQTNQKFYYLFRFINQHFIPGHVSPVVEVELVSDGSYKYTLFDIVGSQEITDEVAVDAPSKPFKKLLQLVPSPAQVVLDDSLVDYGGTAADQITNVVVGNAGTKVWDKTFKVRLTSKKTGKKIDINVTYNLRTE